MSDTLARLAKLSPQERTRVLASLRATVSPDAVTERPLEALPRDGRELPAAPVQEQFWFLHQMSPDRPTYTIPFSFSIRGPLDTDVLVATLAEIERRHEVLRATLVRTDAGIVHRIAEPGGMPRLEIVDLSGLPEAEADRRAAELTVQVTRTVFDPERGPLLRTLLVRRSPDEHLLLWAAHHAIADGISLGVLAHEIVEVYRSLTVATPPPAEPALQYADYASWQREWLTGKRRDKLVRYWTDLLAGVPVLDLATDEVRPPRQTWDGATAWFRVPADVAAPLRTLADEQGCTLFMVLLAAFEVLLGRHAGQDDFAVGVPVAGRGRPETEPLIGPFLNTVALRADLSGDPDFRTVLTRVRDSVLDGFANQDLPFGAVVEELKQRRDASRNPVYQVMFGFGNTPVSGQELPLSGGVSMVPQGVPNGTARVDLELVMEEDGEELLGRWEYNTALFTPTTANRVVERFRALLGGIATAPGTPVAALPLVPDAELARIAAWNDTAVETPGPGTIGEMVAEQARLAPAAVAVRCDAHSLSYAELDRRADRLAAALAGAGVGRGTGVGVCLERSAETLVVLLGVLRSGAHYVPLDPTYPSDRLAWMLTDSAIRVVVATEGLELPFDATGLQVVHPDAEPGPDDAVAEGPRPDDPAYVIYTSGSTGRPKGVVIEHRSVLNLLHGMRSRLGLGPSDVCGSLASLSFDMAVPEMYLPLLAGGTVVVGGKAEASDGDRLRALVERHGLTMLQATPTTWQLLLDAGLEPGRLRLALCTAEAMPESVAAGLVPLVPSVWNLYGPTETTVFSTMHRITDADLGAPPPIGTPLANTTLHVLDRAGRPVPIGAVGELYIAGDGLATHYRGRPDLTTERFLEGVDGTSRAYRTGDLVRFRTDGVLEYRGRADHQIKLRGFRIEPGEVETVLAGHPGVGRAYVALRDCGPDDLRLVGYVVAGEDVTPAVLREHATAHLPQYMVPSHLLVLTEFPLTPNGKLDRTALLALPIDAGGGAATHVEPAEGLESEIAGVFAQVLGTGSVGRDDDFFLIGGHSLLAAQVGTRIRDRFGVALTFDVIFDRPTVGALAEVVGESLARSTEILVRALERVEGMSEAAVAAMLTDLEISGSLGRAG